MNRIIRGHCMSKDHQNNCQPFSIIKIRLSHCHPPVLNESGFPFSTVYILVDAVNLLQQHFLLTSHRMKPNTLARKYLESLLIFVRICYLMP